MTSSTAFFVSVSKLLYAWSSSTSSGMSAAVSTSPSSSTIADSGSPKVSAISASLSMVGVLVPFIQWDTLPCVVPTFSANSFCEPVAMTSATMVA